MTSSEAAPLTQPLASGTSGRIPSHATVAIQKTAPISPDTGAAREFFATCVDLDRRVNAFIKQTDPSCPGVNLAALQRTQAQARRTIEVIKEALEKYSLDTLALSYNGGKDCLVLMILYLAALPSYFASDARSAPTNNASANDFHTNSVEFTTLPPEFPPSLPAIYIEAPNPFIEVDQFVDRTSKAYHLSLMRREGAQGMRAAFTSYLAENPQVRAIFVGTRRSDPHGSQLEPFQATDRGWPAFMRVHPVLEWRYEDIWTFLRETRVPYCDLYDQGYTSLGGRLDTYPNPALRKVNDGGDVEYRPAYELVGDEAERLGREN